MSNSDLKHDFINNCLRLEFLLQQSSEQLHEQGKIEEKILTDLESFLQLQLEMISKLKKNF